MILMQVNNAGVNFNIGSENSVEFTDNVIATNYFGTKQMIETMIPLMKTSASGARIVNVSSRLGRLNGRRNVSDPVFQFIPEDPSSHLSFVFMTCEFARKLVAYIGYRIFM